MGVKARESPSPRSYGERGWGEGHSGVDARNLTGRKPAFFVVHDIVICSRLAFFSIREV